MRGVVAVLFTVYDIGLPAFSDIVFAACRPWLSYRHSQSLC